MGNFFSDLIKILQRILPGKTQDFVGYYFNENTAKLFKTLLRSCKDLTKSYHEILQYITKILYKILYDLTFTRIGIRFFNITIEQ